MHKHNLRNIFLLFCSLLSSYIAVAQVGRGGSSGLGSRMMQSEAAKPSEYLIGGITVTGIRYLDQDLLIAVTGLTIGQKIRVPNDEALAKAIRNLWKQELFSNVGITVTKYIGDKVFLSINVEERARLNKYNFKGIKASEAKELKDKLLMVKGRVVTDATKKESIVRIQKFYMDKGYGRVQVTVREKVDTSAVNSVMLTFIINKGNKTHINQINVSGNKYAAEDRLKKTLKSTKEMARISLYPADEKSVYKQNGHSFSNYMSDWGFLSPSKTLEALNPYFRPNFFSSSKYNPEKFEEDKQSLVAYYNTLGYRDAAVVADTVYPVQNGNINIDIKIKEGNRYYFGDISWKGNTKYSTEVLSRILNIKKGDVYNQELLEKRMGRQLSPEGGEDISSLYMDDGYLFFNIDPVEVSIHNDTINYEMRITEGAQATIKNITIAGNERTNEHVIRRELRTVPGNKFSRSDLIRSQREIASLGFFDQEKIGIQPKPHPEDGTVDIEYTVVEKSSDQLQLSAGFGGGVNFYGNIGVVFSNFSIRNIFHPKTWDPLPVGDGQKFSLNYSSNGAYYNAFSSSFTEPWLGGHKPNALTTSFTYSKYSGAAVGSDPNSSFLRVVGGGISLSRRLKWPDDFFVLSYGLYYNNYRLKNYALVSNFTDGYSNNLYAKITLARSSIDQPLYPRSGSNISLSFQFTPPYSAFSNEDYSSETSNQKYKWIEYHKYRFTADWYQRISGNLVLKLSTKYGVLGYYNNAIGYSPFERFQLGGDGLSGFSYFIGRDIISQRGYDIYIQDATIFNKYSAELRYPFSLSPTATIYGLVFADAANAWHTFDQYNPFQLNRDAGVGVRIFLPMFGLLGLDYGIGFDKYNPQAGVTGIKGLAKFTFMLGFEPE
ncbi:MAG: outer membrane protein assembly factor [Taibaiella sp.]|nr:outer membrane protein assembly factor [Taibaiella sp.]